MIGMMYLVLTALLALQVSNAVLEKFAIVNDALLNTDVPVVAAVNGAAVGWGMELSLMADLRVASEKAKFGEAASPKSGRPGAGEGNGNGGGDKEKGKGKAKGKGGPGGKGPFPGKGGPPVEGAGPPA